MSVIDLDHEGRVLPFRRRTFAAKRRRRSLWRVALTGLAAALLVVGLPLGVVAWVLTSPRFALRTIDFDGGQRVTAGWVRGALQPLLGVNLVAMPIAEVRALLGTHPWIEGVEVRKQLPDRLVVKVTERVPAALLRDTAGLWYLDASGRRIAAMSAADGAVDLLLVSSSTEGEPEPARALALAAELRQARPDWADKLSEVEVLSDEDFCIYTAALPFPLLVKAGTLADRGRALADLLPEITRRYARVEAVDLRYERRIVIQPAAQASPVGANPEGGADKPASGSAVPARTAA